ncbi:MAG: hypothetical protein K2O44_02230 [Clostridia bacterium]|nr:hypothetical protein [Clostridia bacterium]
MNKFKKILMGLVIAGGISCLAGGAAACSKPKYYTLTFEGSGLDYVLQGALAELDENSESFRSGGTVKKDVEVRFTLSLGSNTTGTPVILVNGEVLEPDENGVYSFIMKADTKVEATGLGSIYNLTLSRFEQTKGSDGETISSEIWVHYYDENGNEFGNDVLVNDTVRVESGKPFKFKVKASPYYVQKYTVSCDTEILEPDANGVYTVGNLKADTTVSVSGLTMEESFITGRPNCGSGTESDPYLLSRPVDLFYLAYIVNDELYTQFDNCYYKLEKDIDLEGEQVFVVGDYSNETAMFRGHFDGNGKTISNFYITDEVVNQSSFESAYLPYVGLFGYGYADLGYGSAEIKNLTLENYEVRVHAGSEEQITLAGSVLGYGVGVEVSNCHADGKLIAINDNNQIMILGGIAGRLQAGYYNDGVTTMMFDSFVRASTSNVYLDGNGSPRSAGGIVGNLVSAAYVLNCTSTADVSGAMHAGGIVGTLGMYCSVTNCYSSSGVNANNSIDIALIDEAYRGAYAGGIVGYAEEDTVIRGCYAANTYLNAESPHGNINKKTGTFYGHCEAAGSTMTGTQSVIVMDGTNSSGANSGAQTAFTSLGWVEKEWTFGGALPQPKALPLADADRRDITITVSDGTNTVHTATRKVGAATPVYFWYDAGELLPRYITSGNTRSWGYYFDKELKNPVPQGFVPAHDITLYAGFADYTQVAGRYYLLPAARSASAYVELFADGTYMVRNGGMHRGGTYTYDGTKIVLLESALALLEYDAGATGGYYHVYEGTVDGSKLNIQGKVTVIGTSNNQPTYTTSILQFSAVKEDTQFKYGEYLDTDGDNYTFEKNGTGTHVENGRTYSFSYVIDGDSLTITEGSGKLNAVVANGLITSIDGVTVSHRDAYSGKWRKTSNSLLSFTFDGIDRVTCTDGKTTDTVEYQPDGKCVAFTWNEKLYKASFDEEGVLVINNERYYVADDFTGTWFLPGSDEFIILTLEGIGSNGYGNALISYSGTADLSLSVQYDVFRKGNSLTLRLFEEDNVYGELTYVQGKITGLIYSAADRDYYEEAQEFSKYDAFRGTWQANVEDIDTLTFNGRTATGSNGTADVTLKLKNGKTRKGTYTLTGANSGIVTITVNGEKKTYTLSLDELANKVELTLDGDTIQLGQRDNWYNAVLTDGDKTYKFDGKGYIGGTVTVSDGNTLPYTVVDGTVTLDGEVLAPQASGTGFDWNGTVLHFSTGLAGEWYVSGTLETLTIAEVSNDFTAKVSYSAASGEYAFTYNPSAGTLTYVESVSGVRVTTTISLAGEKSVYEISISRSGDGSATALSGLTVGREDVWRGTYTAEDGTSWMFDGLGECAYGSGGTATYTDGNVKVAYSYKIDKQGILNIIGGSNGMLFMPAGDGESGFTKDGKTYKIVVPDHLYGQRAFVEYKDGTREWFYFDGRSTLWKEVDGGYEKAYDYEVISVYKVKLTHKETGLMCEAELRKEGVYYCLKLPFTFTESGD